MEAQATQHYEIAPPPLSGWFRTVGPSLVDHPEMVPDARPYVTNARLTKAAVYWGLAACFVGGVMTALACATPPLP